MNDEYAIVMYYAGVKEQQFIPVCIFPTVEKAREWIDFHIAIADKNSVFRLESTYKILSIPFYTSMLADQHNNSAKSIIELASEGKIKYDDLIPKSKPKKDKKIQTYIKRKRQERGLGYDPNFF